MEEPYMRQNNKNNRSRGRGRKGPNPLSRSYESNGPDVKVRGTAQHVAEKYLTLARDALSSGDGISAENYFQHAEHYNRIIMGAQAQQNAAREEERKAREHSALESDDKNDGDDQPSIENANAFPRSQNIAEVERVATSSEDESQEETEEAPKKRRRRVARPRRQTISEEVSSSDKKDNNTSLNEASDMLADNPPAFLISE